MREFDFSEGNLKRIGREYRERRKALQYAKAELEHAEKAAHYRNHDEMIAEAQAKHARVAAAFAEIKAERADYQARGFCR
jgi:hypothetical protein